MSAELEINSEEAYRVLKLDPGVTEAQIKSAYRKLSLRLHPDKRRDVAPEVAAHDFHQLSAAYALLIDPVQRQKSEAKAEENAAAAARRDAYDGKRKAAAEDLVRREEEDRKRRRAAATAQANMDSRLREAQLESHRMMEEASMKRDAPGPPGHASHARQSMQGKVTPAVNNLPSPQASALDAAPPLGPMDKLVTIKLPTAEALNLLGVSGESLLLPQSLDELDTLQTPLARALGSLFGRINYMVIQNLRRRKKTGALSSEITVMVEFDDVVDAFAAATTGSKLAAPPPLDECWIGWAGAIKNKKDESLTTPSEPARIGWMRARGLLPTLTEAGQREHVPVLSATPSDAGRHPLPDPPSFSFQPSARTSQVGSDFESTTLRRLREAARRRVEGGGAAVD